MLRKLWAFARHQVVGEIPDAMAACLDCDAIQCRDDRFLNCSVRLAQAAALKAMPSGRAQRHAKRPRSKPCRAAALKAMQQPEKTDPTLPDIADFRP